MKKALISILTIVFIISMAITVNAATGSISSGASSESVLKGKTFTVTLAGVSDTPIDGMYTKFTYDTNVLELVSKTPATGYGDNSGEGEILITNSSSSTSPTSGTLYTLTFKVLDSAATGETKISFSGSELHLNNSGTVSQLASNIDAVTITVKADDTTAGGDNSSKDDDSSNSQKDNTKQTITDGNNSTSTTNTSNSASNTAKKTTKKLPQTGINDASLIAIVVLGAVSIASYVSYRKYKNI